MKTDQEYEKLIKKEFGLTANSIWYRKQKWKLETNKEIYDELQLIYTKIGSGANRSLGNKFIKSNLDFNILN